LSGLTVRGISVHGGRILTHATPYPVASENLPPLDRAAGSYRLRFGATPGDLAAVQRLRFEVFNRELGEGFAESWITGRDADPWDEIFHHIIIEHVPSATVVGSYRLQTGLMAEQFGGFYSESEFDLRRLPREVLQNAVEIGRACVHAEHRNGRVIHLLWRGIAAYLLWNRQRYLFGCCSLPTTDAGIGRSVWQQLKREGFISTHHSVGPQREQAVAVRSGGLRDISRSDLPPLFQSYLNLGAEVCGPPALDAEFGTIDFFVLLDLERLEERTRRTFFRDLPLRVEERIA
jgi:putative hemolysin